MPPNIIQKRREPFYPLITPDKRPRRFLYVNLWFPSITYPNQEGIRLTMNFLTLFSL